MSLPPVAIPPETTDPAQMVLIAGPTVEDTVRALCLQLDPPTFFTPMSVDYGESVTEAVYAAMAQARIFVVISSGRRDIDWFRQDGIQEAIHQVRRSRDRRVVPVYLYGRPQDVEADFGLRRIRAIYGSEVGGLPGIARALNALHRRLFGSGDHMQWTRPEIASKADRSDVALGRGMLAGVLADLYPTDIASRALWTRAGGRTRSVPEQADPSLRWRRILQLADAGAGVARESLVRAALKDFPHNRILLAALKVQ